MTDCDEDRAPGGTEFVIGSLLLLPVVWPAFRLRRPAELTPLHPADPGHVR